MEPVAARLSAAEGTSLYVHVPFCVVKCTYCDFFSRVPDDAEEVERTVTAILSEARARAPASPRTVFLGGGTPSYLSSAALRRLLDGLDEACGWRASAVEVTAECNPESLDAEKTQALHSLGVNRLSIGIQSLQPEILRLFERAHDVDQGFAALELARAAGFERLSADLIYSVPGLRAATWEADLTRVLELGLGHLSAYNLAFEEGTTFSHWLASGRLHELDEDEQVTQFQATRRLTRAAGLRAYEVSNFAFEGHECAHNVNYWENGDYVGIGPSAASHLGRTRFSNPRSVRRWVRAIEAGEAAFETEESLSPLRALGESWWLGLRTAAGVDPEAARSRAGLVEHPDPALGLARKLESEGWLECSGGRYRLKEHALLLADALAARFLTRSGPGEHAGVPTPGAPAAGPR